MTTNEARSGTAAANPANAPGQDIAEALVRLGLASEVGEVRLAHLPGGVSSDIWRADLPKGPICVKRALSRLKVSAVWEAPLERNHYEYEWLAVAAEIDPTCVPRLLAHGDGLFAMEYLPHPVWKAQLREGMADPEFAAKVGRALKAIHEATRGCEKVAARFPTDAIFHTIRIEPYLLATAAKHPDLATALKAIAERTAGTHECLVHGDISPKNILAGPQGPVFLDAECAWYGDPAFDLAFCLNHLLLKCLWVPKATPRFLACFDALVATYAPDAALEQRAAALLPALLLSRVDGKSPVEYLDAAGQAHVRALAPPLIQNAPQRLEDIRNTWQKSFQ